MVDPEPVLAEGAVAETDVRFWTPACWARGEVGNEAPLDGGRTGVVGAALPLRCVGVRPRPPVRIPMGVLPRREGVPLGGAM